MSTQQNLLTIIILWFCVLSNFWSQVSAARYVNVAFPSNATSGNLILHGTIVYPSSDPPATGYIPAILIGGSGPGNRWLNTTSSFLSTSLVGNRPTLSYQPWNFCYVSNEIVSPYYDITTHLADTANMAVLTWDKRTCTIFQKCEGKSCGCQTVPCTLPNQQNCLEINKILNTDFIEDSINALNYLLFTQTFVKVNVNEAAVMGHSAGTTQAPIVALNLTSKYVKKVALIAGPAAPIMTTLSRQYSTSLVQNLAWVNGSLCNMSIPGEANLISALARGIPADMATIENINQENALLQSGYYDNADPFTPVTIIGATLPLLFWQQAISLSSYNSTSYYINSYLQQSSTTSLLAMNSDQDFNVSPFEFLPLGTIIQGAQSFATPSRVGQVVIPFLTHLQIDSSNLSNHVAPEPLAVLQCYFTSTDLLNCASQISKAESRSKSLLHHPGQPNDKFVDNIFVRTNNLI